MRKRIKFEEERFKLTGVDKMIGLSFQLCSRCKKCVNIATGSLVTIQVASSILGGVCGKCSRDIENKVKEMLEEIPIPETLQPYLIPPKNICTDPDCLKRPHSTDDPQCCNAPVNNTK